MAEISAKLVKELRDRTGLGMMECKKALQEADGDIETAIDNLRKSGQAKAAKKAGNIAADGAIIIAQEGNKALLLEVNCQTDFVAKDDNFKNFSDKVATAALAAGATFGNHWLVSPPRGLPRCCLPFQRSSCICSKLGIIRT